MFFTHSPADWEDKSPCTCVCAVKAASICACKPPNGLEPKGPQNLTGLEPNSSFAYAPAAVAVARPTSPCDSHHHTPNVEQAPAATRPGTPSVPTDTSMIHSPDTTDVGKTSPPTSQSRKDTDASWPLRGDGAAQSANEPRTKLTFSFRISVF